MGTLYVLILAALAPLEQWMGWLTVQMAWLLWMIAWFYPLVMAILALKNGGGGHWYCLWLVSFVGITLGVFMANGIVGIAFGLIYMLLAVFVFRGQRELNQRTDSHEQ
jgi:hypothetical protein